MIGTLRSRDGYRGAQVFERDTGWRCVLTYGGSRQFTQDFGTQDDADDVARSWVHMGKAPVEEWRPLRRLFRDAEEARRSEPPLGRDPAVTQEGEKP